MTVLEATNKLLEFFAQNEHFELIKDFTKIMLVSDTDADQAAILIALEELEKQKFVIRKVINEQEFWVLVKPLAFQEQDLQISLMTGIQIAAVINKFVAKEEDKISPLRITEQEILNLVLIANK